jgi:hypothetical protein
MADPGTKKVTILKSSIETISGVNQNYVIRYRIVSEDKNRSSHWSPQYSIPSPTLDTVEYSVTIGTGSPKTIVSIWEHTQGLSADNYDVYLKWTVPEIAPAIAIPDVWEYITTTSSPSFSTIKRSGATKVQVAVQVPTFPKERFTASTLFESPEYSV